MRRQFKVLALFDAIAPTTLDQDLSKELKTEDWKTERDILKALGLGAQFVFIGRPFNYASALGGEAGVDHVIGLLRTQLRADLGMLGLRSLQEMNRDVLFLDGFRAVGQR